MRKLYVLQAVLLLTACGGSGVVNDFDEWAKKPVGTLQEQPFAQVPLTKVECAEASKIVDSLWVVETKKKYGAEWKKLTLTNGPLRLSCACREFGLIPSDGRSMYISLHGGGGCPKEVNDQQWTNQIYLYEPAEGLYVAPRAPWNTPDLWHKEGLDSLFEALIQSCVAFEGVNPDKVYLLGYSAGGDGVWRMAPRMADRWAAASMMAGHPGGAQQVNMRNTPFMIWVGELDGAYERNKRAMEKGDVMDSLQKADPQGYIHETYIVKGKGHWMDGVDAAALPWMAQYKRNPYPEKIVWRQEGVTRSDFYWLSAPKDELTRGKRVDVERKGNDIYIQRCDYSELTIFLNDTMFDLDAPVRIHYQGELLYSGQVQRTISHLYHTALTRRDLRYIFPASISVKIK